MFLNVLKNKHHECIIEFIIKDPLFSYNLLSNFFVLVISFFVFGKRYMLEEYANIININWAINNKET
jgi:hypothetical protein